MTIPENILSLHAHEEDLRSESLATIENSEDLKDHLAIIQDSMSIIHTLSQEYICKNDDELTIQLLGLRIFNASSSTLKLALSGYYQVAFSIIRDIVETSWLIDYLGSNLDEIQEWKKCDTKIRMRKFSPSSIRKALNKRDKSEGNKRSKIYGQLSEFSSHATSQSFQLISPNGLGKIGPFYEEKYLRAWIEESAKYITHAGVIYLSHFPNVNLEINIMKNHFLKNTHSWGDKYLKK